MELLQETLPDAHVWWRIADPDWANPLDPGFAQRRELAWYPATARSVARRVRTLAFAAWFAG